MAEQNNSFFTNAKNVKLTLIVLSLLSFALLIFLPMAKADFGGDGAGLFELLKDLSGKSLIAFLAPVILSIVAFFMTLGSKTKSKRWTAGIILAIGFILFMLFLPSGLKMGLGMIVYLILTIAYLVVNYLSKI